MSHAWEAAPRMNSVTSPFTNSQHAATPLRCALARASCRAASEESTPAAYADCFQVDDRPGLGFRRIRRHAVALWTGVRELQRSLRRVKACTERVPIRVYNVSLSLLLARAGLSASRRTPLKSTRVGSDWAGAVALAHG